MSLPVLLHQVFVSVDQPVRESNRITLIEIKKTIGTFGLNVVGWNISKLCFILDSPIVQLVCLRIKV